MKYYISMENNIIQRMSRYLIVYADSYTKIKILPLLVWRNTLTLEEIEKERSILKKEMDSVVKNSQKYSGILRRSKNFEFIVSKLITISSTEVKDILIVSKKNKDVKKITSIKSNTSYTNITIFKSAEKILVRFQIERLNKRTSITKELDGSYSVEFLIKKFVSFRCEMLGIETPKEFNFDKALETAKDLGYVNPSGNYIDIEFDINDVMSSKVKKRENKHITEFIYNPINTTGYKHISVSDNGFGKPTMVLAIKIDGKEHRKTILIDETTYKDVLKEFIKEKMNLLNINLNVDIKYDKCLESIRNIKGL